MDFKKWLQLQEVGTGTNAIASFARPISGVLRTRLAPKPMVFGDPDEEEKKKREALDSE